MKKRKVEKYLFIVYLVVLVWVLLFKFGTSISDVLFQALHDDNDIRNINLIPFGESMGMKEMMFNVIMFIPFGVLVQMMNKKGSRLKKIMYILSFSVLIELGQFVLALGATDITDVINNTAGGMMGVLLYILLSKIFHSDRLDTILMITGTILYGLPIIRFAFLLTFGGVRYNVY